VPGSPAAAARKSQRGIALGFDCITAKVGDHIAHLYTTREEKLRVLGPFITTGLQNGDHCVVYSTRAITGLRKWLVSEGIKRERVEESGQLLIIVGRANARTHGRLVACIERETEADGYHLLRVADGCGVLGGCDSPAEMLKWESIFDASVAGSRPVIGLCQYDLKHLRGDTIIATLRVHPLCIVADKLIRNPFYAPLSQHGLTSREIEILQHIVWGKKDSEIATALGVGERTVETHVAHIRAKLGVTSRAAAAARVVREGIIE
jgi:DNA-binding CsgD family transcriptional regulator